LQAQIATALKNAFINTEFAKSLFYGLQDNVTDMIKEMFRADENLGAAFDPGTLETPQDYIEAIKKYMELSNEQLSIIFGDLGISLDNLTDSVNTLNENLSKNTVSGMATNLWKYNIGQAVENEFDLTLTVPIIFGTEEFDRKIIKITNDSLIRSRRGNYS